MFRRVKHNPFKMGALYAERAHSAQLGPPPADYRCDYCGGLNQNRAGYWLFRYQVRTAGEVIQVPGRFCSPDCAHTHDHQPNLHGDRHHAPSHP